MTSTIRQMFAVARKDAASEMRTRYALNAQGMFVVVTISVIAFATAGDRLDSSISAALLWIAMFFAAVTGLGRSFVSEEERGTTLLLRLTVPPTPVYFGKLLINMVLALAANAAIALLFALIVGGAGVKNLTAFVVVVLLMSLGFAAALTIVAAIIARASSRGALYPVLGFPVLLPLLLLGVDMLRRSIAGIALSKMGSDLILFGLYTLLLLVVSYFLFDLLWKE